MPTTAVKATKATKAAKAAKAAKATKAKCDTNRDRQGMPSAPLGPGGRPPLVKRRVFRTPMRRRVAYALAFEAMAVVFTTLILAAFGNSAEASALIGAVSSVVALIWNMAFNTLFERWEKRSGVTGRPVKTRLLHALLFEGGLVLFLVPLAALILQVSLGEAFLYEAGLIAFFFIYNAGYTWCFDRVFGLPDSARQDTTS